MALFILISSVVYGYSCTLCQENHYCTKGIEIACPANTPVTNGEGKSKESDCMTCAAKNSSTPAFDGEDCITCYEYDPTAPYWNGTSCSACPNGKQWNDAAFACEYTCVFEIPHGSKTLCLTESVDVIAFKDISPKSADEETTKFKEKYGIENTSSGYPDYWAGAMKYCQNKGLRLPEMDELVSIMNVVYNTSKTCSTSCTVANSSYVGLQDGCCSYGTNYDGIAISASNTELWNFLKSGTKSNTSIQGHFYLWSSVENSKSYVHGRNFFTSYSSYYYGNRTDTSSLAVCVTLK